MCLIAFAWQQHPDYPLVLIANRDEFYARPSLPAAWWSDNADIAGGKDLDAGGSWLALHRDGRFAAVTNHRDGHRPRTGQRSRGKLISEYLHGTLNAAQYSHQLRDELAQYGGCNLLLGDGEQLYYLSNRGADCRALAPGLYGLSNAFLDTAWPKTDALKQRLAAYLQANPTPAPGPLAELMLDTTPAADAALPDTGIRYEWEKMLSACFIRADTLGYGTRATTVLMQHRHGQRQLLERSFDATGQTGEVQLHC